MPSDETILVPGYQEIWVGILLADRTVLPLTRRLWTENGPDFASMNLAELAEIRRAAEILRETFKLGVILVADSGFRRKELLHWLKLVEGMDFVIRLEGKLLVKAGESRGLMSALSEWWPRRMRIQWREKSKKVLLSDVSARQVSVQTESKEKVSFNAVRLTPAKQDVDPMYLATTLTTESVADLTVIVRLYSWRVFSSWAAIDRLLAAAHMAYLILVMMAELAKRGATGRMRSLMRRLNLLLRLRFARPQEEMTLGRFLRLMALDFPSPRLAARAGRLP